MQPLSGLCVQTELLQHLTEGQKVRRQKNSHLMLNIIAVNAAWEFVVFYVF